MINYKKYMKNAQYMIAEAPNRTESVLFVAQLC